MPKDIVIDANVILYATGGHDNSRLVSCSRVFYKVIDDEELRIALDYEHEILGEYEENIRTQRTGQSQAFEEMIEEEAYGRGGSDVFTFRLPIDEDNVSELSEEGFHTSDLIYVRIAPKTELQTIITTDERSFLEEGYERWIQNNLSVDIYMPDECLDEVLN